MRMRTSVLTLSRGLANHVIHPLALPRASRGGDHSGSAKETPEAAALQVADVNFLRRQVHIARQVQRETRDVATVQRALGHAKATTTLNTYSHLWPSAEDRTRSAAAGMLVEPTTGSNAADCLRTGLALQASDQQK